MAYSAVILADSINPYDARLTTFAVEYPRFILAEVNMHRDLSRNAESSRAITVEDRIRRVREDPFIPEAFGTRTKRMQAGAPLEGMAAELARDAWLDAAADACVNAERLAAMDVHKQLANRVLESFSWVRGVISATRWGNFFALRCHPDAQPEFRKLAEMMRDAMDASVPRFVDVGGWHLPWVDADEADSPDAPLICAGRCARVSYGNGGRGGRDDAIALANRLRDSGHMSPFEHAAQCVDTGRWFRPSNFHNTWLQYRKTIRHEHDFGAAMRARRADV